MTLLDTSAWVEYLRATGSDVHREVHRAIERERPIHTTDVVVMEVLAGARDERHAVQLRRLLFSCEFVPINGLADFGTRLRSTDGAGSEVKRSAH